MAKIEIMHSILLGTLAKKSEEMETPTLIVIKVRVNKIDNAVFEVSSPFQYR